MIPKEFDGEIRCNTDKEFGYFAMDTEKIKNSYARFIGHINKLIYRKGLTGEFHLCRFENHNGKNLKHKIDIDN